MVAQHESLTRVPAAQLHRANAPFGACHQCQVVSDPGCRLVAQLRLLLQQQTDEVAQQLGHFDGQLSQPGCRSGDVRVQQRELIGVRERRSTGEQLEQDQPQHVEIGALIDGTVHAPRLLGRGEKQRATVVAGARCLRSQAHRPVEAPDASTQVRADCDALRRQRVVRDPSIMDLRERLRQRHRHLQPRVEPGAGCRCHPSIELVHARCVRDERQIVPRRNELTMAHDTLESRQGPPNLHRMAAAGELPRRRVGGTVQPHAHSCTVTDDRASKDLLVGCAAIDSVQGDAWEDRQLRWQWSGPPWWEGGTCTEP